MAVTVLFPALLVVPGYLGCDQPFPDRRMKHHIVRQAGWLGSRALGGAQQSHHSNPEKLRIERLAPGQG